MRKDIYEELICAENSMDLKKALKEAEKLELVLNDCHVRLNHIKIEKIEVKCKVEEFENNEYYDIFSNDYNITDHNEILDNKNDNFDEYDTNENNGIDPTLNGKVKRKKSQSMKNYDSDISENYDQENDSDFDYEAAIKLNSRCDLCNKSFKNKDGLNTHLKMIHGQNNYKKKPCGECEACQRLEKCGECYFCKRRRICKFRQCKKPIINDGKEEQNLLKCDHCDVNFTSKTSKIYKDHLKDAHKDMINYCDLCPRQRRMPFSVGDSNLELHKMTIHGEKDPNDPTKIICAICKVPQLKHRLNKHIKRNHFKLRPHQCDRCPKTFFQKTELNDHLEKVHVKSKTYKCKLCDLTFNTEPKYNYHKSNFHNTSTYICDACGKSFPTQLRLNSHIPIHNEKTFICDLCGFDCKTEEQLLRHKSQHLEKTFKCSVDGCDKVFNNHTNMMKHRNNYHKVKEKKFVCKTCCKKFGTEKALTKHHRVQHLGIRDLKCDQCDWTGSYKPALKDHIDTVHKGVMYKCDYPGCTKEMNRKRNLDQHKKTAHGILKPFERKPPKIILS